MSCEYILQMMHISIYTTVTQMMDGITTVSLKHVSKHLQTLLRMRQPLINAQIMVEKSRLLPAMQRIISTAAS